MMDEILWYLSHSEPRKLLDLGYHTFEPEAILWRGFAGIGFLRIIGARAWG